MFNKFFKNKPKTEHEQHQPEKDNKKGQPTGHEEIHNKPFDIDLNDLFVYDENELHYFIKRYEQHTTFLRNKYNDLLSEYLIGRERLTLFEEERKRLMTENEQSKLYVEQLKKALDERAVVSSIGEIQSTKSSSPHKGENITLDVLVPEHNDDGAMEELKLKAEKLIEELRRVREGLSVNMKAEKVEENVVEEGQKIDEPLTEEVVKGEAEEPENVERPQEGEKENVEEEGEKAEHLKEEEKPEEVQNVEEKDEEKTGEEKQDDVPLENMEEKVQEAVEAKTEENIEAPEKKEILIQEGLLEMLDKAEIELKNILNGYWEAYDRAKLKEKEIINKLKCELIEKARNEEQELEIKELKGTLEETKTKLNKTTHDIHEVENKMKIMENENKALEESYKSLQTQRNQLNETLTVRQNRITEIEKISENLRKDFERTEKALKTTEEERDEVQKALKRAHEDLVQEKEKAQKELANDREKHVIELNAMEIEKEKAEKKLAANEAKKNDIENALIQEKLKHHQTASDLARAKERIEEVEKDLNDEVDARKVDVRKNEEFKKHLVEMERKMKEYRKMIKKLSEQILNVEQRGEPSLGFENTPSNRSEPETNDPSEPNEIFIEASHKAEIINNQYAKIQQLEEKLEEVLKELDTLKEANKRLSQEKDEMKTQVKVLQEKRETGLQEIRRLSLMVEQHRGKSAGVLVPQTASQANIMAGKQDDYLKIMKTSSMKDVKSNYSRASSHDFENLMKIKKGLDEVYKSIILAITNANINEAISDKKPTGKLGQLVKGPMPSGTFINIEKKMNDTIVMFQEYLENFE